MFREEGNEMPSALADLQNLIPNADE